MEAPTTRLRKPAKTELDSMAIPQSQEDITHLDANEPLLTEATSESPATEWKPNNEAMPTPTGPFQYAKSGWTTVKDMLGESYTSFLIPFIFLGIIAGRQDWDDSLVFLLNFLAILPLASLLSFATEELAKSVGQLLGGLINATFGNAVEMIVRQILFCQFFSRNITNVFSLIAV